MASTKITGLTALNVDAIDQTISSRLVSTTNTTATFYVDPEAAVRVVESAISQLPPGKHPRHSLFAVLRKLKKQVEA